MPNPTLNIYDFPRLVLITILCYYFITERVVHKDERRHCYNDD